MASEETLGDVAVSELEQLHDFESEGDFLYIVDAGGTSKKMEASEVFWQMANFIGSHNCLYRGQDLGDHVSDEQWAEIKSGNFKNLFIGDYWEINGVKWLVAAFDYFMNTGSSYKVEDHHIVIVPEGNLYTAQMNSEATTSGAYAGSEMYSTNLNEAKTMANDAFGSAHILTHENYFTNAINATYTYPNAGAWYDCTLEIMNEEMVYGTTIVQQQVNSTYRPTTMTVGKSQLPLFRHRHDLIGIGATWWLRDIFSDANFCTVNSGGSANTASASSAYGVRPAFCIYES